MSDIYPPEPPPGLALQMAAPPKVEVVALPQTGSSHLPEIATLAGMLLMAGIVLVALARKVRS